MINFEAFFKVSYGLYIVSTGDDKVKNGFISNSVFQVTAEPAQFAACCNKDNHSASIIEKTGVFSISVLSQDAPKELIGQFGYKSGKNIDKFENIEYKTSENGAPLVLSHTVSVIECKVNKTVDVGTHLIFIGEVVSAELLDETATPITYAYYRETHKGLAPKNAPTYIDRKKLSDTEAKSDKKSASPKYKCPACGYIYDPEKGDPDNDIEPGTAFEDLPDDWVCPVCGTEKEDFVKM